MLIIEYEVIVWKYIFLGDILVIIFWIMILYFFEKYEYEECIISIFNYLILKYYLFFNIGNWEIVLFYF